MKNFNLSRQIAKSLGVTTSMEDFDVDVNIGTNPDMEVDENGAQLSPVTSSGELTPEAEQVEVVEETQETEEVAAESEELDEDVETLESIQMVLQNSLSQGGLDSVSVEMFNITLDRILGKHGIESKDLIPSMEDFGDNRYHATQVSMEKVGSALKSFKDGALDVFKQLWQNLKKMLFKIVQFFKGGVAKRADKLIEKANKAKSEKLVAKEKTIKLYAADKLEVNGKIENVDAIVTAFGNMVNAHKKYSGNYAKVVEQGISAFQTLENSSAYKTFTDAVNNSFNVSYNTINKKAEFASFDLVLGNAVIVYNYEKYSITLEKKNNMSRKDGGANQMAAVMTLDQIIAVAGQVKSSVDAIQAFDAIYNNKGIEAKLMKEVDALYNGYKEADDSTKGKGDDDLNKQHKSDRKNIVKLFKSYLGFGGKLSSHITATSKGMLDYAAQSLSVYGKKK